MSARDERGRFAVAAPASLKALRRQLRAAVDVETRDRIERAIAYVGRLYGLPIAPDKAPDLDLKRRERFVASSHRLVVRQE